MVNGIKMRSFLNPIIPWKIMRHMVVATPKLEQNGVQFLKGYQVSETLYGRDEFEVFFFTIWPSENVFYKLHNTEDFIRFTRSNRNKAFSAFAESKVKLFDGK